MLKVFIAVVKHENNRVTKYQDFDTQVEADAHVATYGGFVDDKPSDRLKYWVVDADKKTLVFDEASCKSDDAAIAAVAYRDVRRNAYPDYGEQLDALYKDMLADKGDKTGDWFKAVQKVKTDIPKP